MSLLFLFYGALAGLALAATWQDSDLLWIGGWLCGGWALSNVLDWWAPMSVRIAGYTAIEVLIAIGASYALAHHRSKWLIALIAINMISIGMNLALALHDVPNKRQIYAWVVTTNLTFAAECLVAIGVGVGHGIRAGRFDSWLHLCRRAFPQGASWLTRKP